MNKIVFSMKFTIKLILFLHIAALTSSIFILSCVPPVSKDALTHHLAVPKLYVEHGGIYEIPSVTPSYYPMNVDLLYVIPLIFGNDIVPKYIHFIFALLTAWLIFDYLKRRLDAIYALTGVLLFLSIPLIVKLSITVYVDLGLIFFSTAAIVYLLKWRENSFEIKYLIVSSLYCGLALGTKYNGIMVSFLLTLFIPIIYLQQARGIKNNYNPGNDESVMLQQYDQFRAIGYCALYLVIALIMFSPWMIKNYIWTGNPIYPLYDQFFNPVNTSSGISLGVLGTRELLFGEKWWEIALVPFRIFFQGQDGSPRYFDGKLNAFLFILPLFSIISLNRDDNLSINRQIRSETRILAAFAVLFVVFAFFTVDMRVRYIAPIIPPLVILSIFGLKGIQEFIAKQNIWHSEKVGAGIIGIVIIIIFNMNASYFIKQFKQVRPISYLSGKVTRDEYIEKHRPEYSSIKYANSYLVDSSKIFGLFIGNRLYYSDREIIFDKALFKRIVRNGDSSDVIFNELKMRKITHFIIGFDLFENWTSFTFNEKEKVRLQTFFKDYTKLLFKKGGYGLFKLQSV